MYFFYQNFFFLYHIFLAGGLVELTQNDPISILKGFYVNGLESEQIILMKEEV